MRHHDGGETRVGGEEGKSSTVWRMRASCLTLSEIQKREREEGRDAHNEPMNKLLTLALVATTAWAANNDHVLIFSLNSGQSEAPIGDKGVRFTVQEYLPRLLFSRVPPRQELGSSQSSLCPRRVPSSPSTRCQDLGSSLSSLCSPPSHAHTR